MRSRLWRWRWWLNRLLYAAAIVLPLAAAVASALATVAGKLHIDQGTGLAVVAALASALTPALRWLRRHQAQESKRQAALAELVHYLGPVQDAEPEQLGVAPSQAEDRGYLPRPRSDQPIQTALAGQRFVVVVGDSAAGKSRSALEAACQLWPRNTLVAPIRSGLPRDGLGRIVELVESPRSPVILWLDDLDQYLVASALSVDQLSRWATRNPKVTVLATMQAGEWENWRFPSAERPEGKKAARPRPQGKLGIEEVGEQAAAVLRQATRVDLAGTLETAEEREQATQRYGAHDWAALGLGEVLAAGPDLVAKLSGGRRAHPRGCAVAEAAADWRRAGVGRPITSTELEDLSMLYLPDWASRPEDFEAGLTWATAPIKPRSEVRIVSPRVRGQRQETHYEIHDYVAASRVREGHSLPERAWSWILHSRSITADELMRIATTAYARQDLEAAIAVYEQMVERFGEASEPGLREQVAKALFSKAVLLGAQGEGAVAIAVYEQVVERFGEASEPGLREQVAKALFSKAAALGAQGQEAAAIAVYEQVVERFGEASEPGLREVVAMAKVLARQARSELRPAD